jgi:hypothetical protein
MRWQSPGPVRHPPGFIAPYLPTNGHTVPTGPQWVYEIKRDGLPLQQAQRAATRIQRRRWRWLLSKSAVDRFSVARC